MGAAISTIHSEFAALVSEKSKRAIQILQKEALQQKLPIENLNYQIRATPNKKAPSSIPDI